LIYIVDIEAVDTRYTKQWKDYLPKQLKRSTNQSVEVISGGDTPQATTPGAFLNFGGTNVYKSKQLEIIGEKFCNGEIKDGDYFLYTDAWNPTVIQLRYMAELLGVNIRIGGLWHAGSYDPQDFLGRLIGDKPWVRNAERSMFECYDNNFFASDFHINIFVDAFKEVGNYVGLTTDKTKVQRVGWPMEYLKNSLDSYRNMPKENVILFPHRIAPEKQPDIFRDLRTHLPDYELIVCQEQDLTKIEYHNLLGRAKLVFSANLQETLGISWYEGALVDTLPMVPDRLSYKEMALDEFKYPSEWTESFSSYEHNRVLLINKIKDYMENYDTYLPALRKQVVKLQADFFSGEKLYGALSNES
jgi:glycosyltransferase involved in cell wall biosynthesis|tara:strand:- start:4687 stop:5760 length:1074 start_codon:yes stop_codon:yes gene_type:complete